MSQETWTAVDAYIEAEVIPSDPVLTEALRDSQAAELPAIQVSPAQGKLLYVLARSINARSILELGTLGGYSAIWLARALPADGKLISLELSPKHAQVAAANIARAGLSDKVEIRVGDAVELLTRLGDAGTLPFDLVFIDADKANLALYFQRVLTLTHPGSLIVTDNVVRHGEVINPASEDASVQGVRRFFDAAAREEAAGRVSTTTLQTVGSKGYDGFALSVVL